jgi:hypothetical protein
MRIVEVHRDGICSGTPQSAIFFIDQRFTHKPEFIESLKSAVLPVKTGKVMISPYFEPRIKMLDR